MSAPDVAFSILLLACGVVLVRSTTGPGFRFSPVLLFFVIFTLQQAFGCMALVVEDDPGSRLARTGLALGIAGFTLGVVAATICAGFDPGRELAAVRGRFRFDEPDLATKVPVLVLAYLLATAVLTIYFARSGGIPLFQGIGAFLSGDEARVAQQLLKEKRMELTYFEKSSYRGQGYVDQFRIVVLPYVVPCFVVWARASRRVLWRVLAFASAGPTIVFLMGTGQRHPVAAFLLGMAIVGYVLCNPRLHRRILLGFGSVGFVVFFALTYLLGRYTHTDDFGQDMLMVFRGIWNRIVYSNAVGTLALFDLFPNPEPFRGGMTWVQDLQGFLPGPYVAFSAWLHRRLYGFVGTAAPMCFGEMYANFGLPGVFVGGALLGMVLQGFHVWWARRRTYGIEHVVLYALACMGFMRWGMGGLLVPIQHGIVGLPLFYGTIRGAQVVLSAILASIRASLDSEPHRRIAAAVES